MNKKKITCLFIIKSCSHLSPWIFNGLESVLAQLDPINIKKEIMLLLAAFYLKFNSGI